MNNFVHLHVHSDYSILDGAAKITKLIEKASKLNQPALAITEHGNVDSAYKFYSECKKQGIKPILGCEMYLANSIEDRIQSNNHLVLLCKDYDGWLNLLKLIKIANTKGFYYKPRIDYDLLGSHHDGLICLTACLNGPVARPLSIGDTKSAQVAIERLKGIFGRDLYVEIQNHGLVAQQKIIESLKKIANSNSVKVVATNDVHYVERDDWKVQEILICESYKKSYQERQNDFNPPEFYLKSRDEMEKFLQDGLDTTLEIAEKCDIKFPERSHILPRSEEVLFDAYIRLGKTRHRKLFDSNPEYKKRLEHEISVIKGANLVGYFMTVQDFVHYAKTNGVMVGAGRGSSGGSLVAFLLGITEVDPIKYNLLFSRFYNAGRKKSLPDIDVDFSSKNIGNVFSYIASKYGYDNICHIGTVNTYAPKAAIKAICRVFQVPFKEANAMTDLIDVKAKHLKDELEENEKIKDKYHNDKTAYSGKMTFKDIFDLAMKIEGMISHKGVHAAGIIISPFPLEEMVPIRKEDKATFYVSCWAMDDIEAIGLVKYDFLRLDNLDAIHDTLTAIRKRLDEIPIDEDVKEVKKTYRLLRKTNNIGIFQLSSTEGSLITNLIKPKCMEDIGVAITLNRPGCINSGLHEKYIKRKNGEEKIDYPHESLESILSDTYGVMIYQEQIIKICMKMAGFSETEADEIRKAMGKKKADLMASMRVKFIDGSMKNKIPKAKAEEIWNLINEFSEYSFNKAHAIGYAHIAYYTAYLKANYPIEYMANLLNTAMTNQDKLQIYLNECRMMEIKILPPDINHAGNSFQPYEGSILYGLMGVKGLGPETVKDILAGRPYKDLFDFVRRSKIDRKGLEALAYAGAFDKLDFNRATIIENIESIMDKAKKAVKFESKKARSLFDLNPVLHIKKVKEFPKEEIIEREYEVLQSYVTYNPLEDYLDWIDENIEDEEYENEDPITIAGYIQGKEIKTSKAGNEYLQLSLYSPTKIWKVLFFSDQYRAALHVISEAKVVWIRGTFKDDIVLGRQIGRIEA